MSYEALHCMPQLSTVHGMSAFANKHIQKKKETRHGGARLCQSVESSRDAQEITWNITGCSP